MKSSASNDEQYFDIDDLKNALKLSYKKRLKLLEDLNTFLLKTMPEKNKEISLKLKNAGF